LVEDPPHFRSEAGQLPGELWPLFGCGGEVQQLSRIGVNTAASEEPESNLRNNDLRMWTRQNPGKTVL